MCTRCRRARGCFYYCALCTLSLAAVVMVVFGLGVHGWLLTQAGLAYGDEMETNIPLETQGQVCTALYLCVEIVMYSAESSTFSLFQYLPNAP